MIDRQDTQGSHNYTIARAYQSLFVIKMMIYRFENNGFDKGLAK